MSLRFGLLQVVLGTGLTLAAWYVSGPAWIVAWPALAVTVVGFGYLGLGPGVFGKRADGSLAPLNSVVLFPYHVAAWLRLRLDALRAREDAWNEVAPGVFLGRRLTTADELPPGTAAVVDLTAEFRAMPGIAGRDYRAVPTLDTAAPEYAAFAEAARWAAAHAGPVYVHCAAGHGRSAALAAGILVLRGAASTVDEAEALLQKARPLVYLHRAQRLVVERLIADEATRATPR
ncbi:MAG: hypothetical protein U0234_01315 [Sandaracinus sp.]